MKKIIISTLIIFTLPVSSVQAATESSNAKANKSACKNIKANYKSKVMSKWSDGFASDQDLLKEINLNIDTLVKRQKSTTGKVKTIIESWVIAEKNTKNALTEKNVKAMTSAMNLKISSIIEFNKICKRIEK